MNYFSIFVHMLLTRSESIGLKLEKQSIKGGHLFAHPVRNTANSLVIQDNGFIIPTISTTSPRVGSLKLCPRFIPNRNRTARIRRVTTADARTGAFWR